MKGRILWALVLFVALVGVGLVVVAIGKAALGLHP